MIFDLPNGFTRIAHHLGHEVRGLIHAWSFKLRTINVCMATYGHVFVAMYVCLCMCGYVYMVIHTSMYGYVYVIRHISCIFK